MYDAKVTIAIQARSTSSRMPRKIFEVIGKKRILDHVISQAQSSAHHIMRSPKFNISTTVAVLYPTGDPLFESFRQSGVTMVDGPEHDVLARFKKAQVETDCDFIVRLTSDCPLIFDFMISKCIFTAVLNDFDYVSNVEEECRMVADGLDCEIMSRAALDWLDANATTKEDREHVTTAIRRVRPAVIRQAFISSRFDFSNEKWSVDTPEDLTRVRNLFHRREFKMEAARRIFGKNVYEL